MSLFFEMWASCLTIGAMYFYTQKDIREGAILGLLSQVGWWGIMFLSGLWGLIPINTIMVGLHVRALYRGYR